MLTDSLLHISRAQINGDIDRAGQWVWLLPIMNRTRRKSVLSFFHFDFLTGLIAAPTAKQLA
jgi:hypothetical protein